MIRDPRVDPKPGDEVRRGHWRKVVEVTDGKVRYMTSKGACNWTTVDRWCKWAKKAVIFHAVN